MEVQDKKEKASEKYAKERREEKRREEGHPAFYRSAGR